MHLYHASVPPYVRGEVRLGHTVTLRLRATAEPSPDRVLVRSAPEGEQTLVEMERRDGGWWEARLRLTVPRFAYRFLALTQHGAFWLNASGLTRHVPTDSRDFKLLPGFPGPSWVREAVLYQVFPDRFCDGDPSNNVRDGEYLLHGKPVVSRRWDLPPRKAFGSREFYGGDLQGVRQRLDHLQGLGVDTVYLNPVFTAPSNHKYDVEDYGAVDPHLGGDAALADLRAGLDERGMRLVLDVVPNHCGETHPWFRAARADRHAPTAEFFTFHRHPDRYESWLGVSSLPRLDYRSQRLREVMFAGPDAVLRRWLRPPFSIDGWRIDVANMLARQGESQLGHKIGRAVRRAVKEENPQAYLVGEHFFDGTPHLQGDELDASMNYRGFTMPLHQWLFGWDNAGRDPAPLPSESLMDQWNDFRTAVPYPVALQQMNLLDSHDMPRVLTIAGGDEARVRTAVLLLVAYPGVPSLYYGDEVGLEGGRDPDCRRPMPWDPARWNHGLLEHYRRCIGLRRASTALRHGAFQPLLADGDTVAFLRESEDERVVVVAQRAGEGPREIETPGIPERAELHEVLGGARATVREGRVRLSPGAWRVVR